MNGGRLGSLRKSFYKALKDAGIERVTPKGKITWHSLRHTFGSRIGAKKEIDATTLQKLLGHADLKTTQRYLHTDEDRKRAAVEAIA